MKSNPFPLFDTFDQFSQLNFLKLSKERRVVLERLKSFPPELRAIEGYLSVRGFLKSHGNNDATFNSYRTQVERMLLWSLLISGKPLLEMRRHDAECFIDFCLDPPRHWISPVINRRFVRVKNSDDYMANPDWRPFTTNIPKREQSLRNDIDREGCSYQMSVASIAQMFAVCSSFFQNSIDEGIADINPFRTIKQKMIYKQPVAVDVAARSLTPLQWSYALQTAEKMADEDPKHYERTLFILATLFSMYLKPADLVGHEGWRPCMGDFRRDTSGNWWFHVISKNNKAAAISVRDEYIEEYLARYRRHLGLSPLPSPNETHPLLTTIAGRAGLTDRNVRRLLQDLFDRTLRRMIEEGWKNDDVEQLRSASLHWLRHTSAAFDAPVRDMKDLQADLRHNCLSTTQNTYYSSSEGQRHHSSKKLPIRKK